jgi:putative chitinase
MRARELQSKYKKLLEVSKINTPIRLAHFFAQIDHESAGFKVLQENLNYSVDGLIKGFGRHRITEAQAREFGRDTKKKANQEAIANILYGGEWGRRNLGNTQVGDGWRFRGRGFKQVTGRSNYTSLSKDVSIDYVNNPDLLLTEADAMVSACWFWSKNNCNRFADADDVVALTRVINGGNKGLKERTELTKKYKEIFK